MNLQDIRESLDGIENGTIDPTLADDAHYLTRHILRVLKTSAWSPWTRKEVAALMFRAADMMTTQYAAR